MENTRSFFLNEDGSKKPNPYKNADGTISTKNKILWSAFIRMQRLYANNASKKEIDKAYDLLIGFVDHHREKIIPL